MATMESMLRNINRQLEAHARMFGTESEIYQDYVRDIESIMGKANYTQRSGAVGYSRRIPMTYKFEDVEKANRKAKGKNTAAAKYSKAYLEYQKANKQDTVTKEEVSKYLKVKESLDKHFDLIYEYLQEANPDFYDTDFAKGIKGAWDDDKIIEHIMKKSSLDTFDKILQAIKEQKEKRDKEKEEAEEKAEGTNKTRKYTKSELQNRRKK